MNSQHQNPSAQVKRNQFASKVVPKAKVINQSRDALLGVMTAMLSMAMLSACVSSPQPTPQLIPQSASQLTPQPFQTAPTPEQPQVMPNVIVVTPPSVIATRPVVPPQPTVINGFGDWKVSFTNKALARGFSQAEIERLLGNAHLNQKVVSQDRSQAEFAKMPWEYVESAVANSRVSNGRKHFIGHRRLFDDIGNRYGVDPAIVAAIWGMESSYGGFMGNANLVSSLATLAYDGRRRDFAEEQLMSLLTLLSRGDVSWHNLDGSWAGGMGHTQFIPATWLTQGVDGDGNGHKNPWNLTDALNSTANYLSNSGWVRGVDPVYEVSLPSYFDYRYLDSTMNYDEWRQLGVQVLGGYVPANARLSLWLPAGKLGPALLTSQNFDVIKVYNNSANYALGVSLLAKAINGQGGLQTAWPKYERPLTTVQVTNLQRHLTQAGYDTHGIDGVIGSNTRKAFARWQAVNGQVPDGFITQDSAKSLIW